MEALQGRRLLIQAPNFPAAGYGSRCCAITSFKAGRVSLSSSPISCHSPHSFACGTSAKGTMKCSRGRSLCTAATGGNWLCPSPCPSPAPPPREVKLRAGSAGNLSSLRSSSSGSWSPQDFRELLLVAWHTPGRNGRGYFVTITTNLFDLGHRRRTAITTGGGPSLSYKDLKISASSIFYWLKRNRRELLESSRCQNRVLPSGSHWRTPLLHRFFRYTTSPSSAAASSRAGVYVRNVRALHGVGYVRSSTSDYYNGYSSVSSQAEGNTASLDSNATLVDHQLQQRSYPNGEREDFLATGYGWRVRDAAKGELTELIRVADIQTGAFHEKSPVFDELFYKIFHAEVLSSLQYKARSSDFDRYSCLLAERDPGPLDSVEGSELAVVGAVDITAFADKNIVCHLPGAEEYLYVSGMAVESAYRRQGVATLLLEGCLARAIEWGFEYLVLHAYEDDFRARNVYSRAGYNTISGDPVWMTKFFGRRRRVVMARRTREIVDSGIPP